MPPVRKKGFSSYLLALVWPSPSHCGNLRSELAYGKPPSLSLALSLSLKIQIKFLKRSHESSKWKIKSATGKEDRKWLSQNSCLKCGQERNPAAVCALCWGLQTTQGCVPSSPLLLSGQRYQSPSAAFPSMPTCLTWHQLLEEACGRACLSLEKGFQHEVVVSAASCPTRPTHSKSCIFLVSRTERDAGGEPVRCSKESSPPELQRTHSFLSCPLWLRTRDRSPPKSAQAAEQAGSQGFPGPPRAGNHILQPGAGNRAP